MELNNMYEEMLKNRDEKFKARLSQDQKAFIAMLNARQFNESYYYVKEFMNGFNSGKYTKPSDYIEDKLDWIFEGYVFTRFKNALCYAVDKSINWAYSTSYYRRSFRRSTYIVNRIFDIIYDFHREMTIDKDVADILTGRLADEEMEHLKSTNDWNRCGCGDKAVAYELDQGNEKVEEAITDIINGEGIIPLKRFILNAIVKSNNEKMHKLLGQLLLAARLQEGLRQSICECMDVGTVEAFKSLLKVIDDNNLIRYSSVKRAVGAWLGLIEPDAKALERISNKSLELIVACIENIELAKDYIKSEDCMKIYIGLWSIGVYDVNKAMELVKDMSQIGTNHQILTTGYFCANLDSRTLAHTLAKVVIKEHRDKQDILAVFMPYFMQDGPRFATNKVNQEMYKKEYFDSEEEVEEYYKIMQYIYEGIDGKTVEFSPCIFPWFSACLKKSHIIENMCRMADMLNDNNKKDYLCGLLKECDTDDRSGCVSLVLTNPKTRLQKETVTAMLCDRETYTRKTAASIVANMQIEDENYLQMEEMLKYKAADMRATIIEFLCKQEDEKLIGTIKRLLADIKEEKKTAGLDMAMQVLKDNKRESIHKQTKEYVKAIVNPTAKEKVLIDSILGESKVTKETIVKNEKYKPQINDVTYYKPAIEVFVRYFPDSKIFEKTSLFNVFKQKTESFTSALANCESLHTLFLEHINDEYRTYGGEISTFGSSRRIFREILVDGDTNTYEIPGLAIWKEWYEKHIVKPERLLPMLVLLRSRGKGIDFYDSTGPYIEKIYGKGFDKIVEFQFKHHLLMIVERLIEEYVDKNDMAMLAIAFSYWYVKFLPKEDVLIKAIPPQRSMAYHVEREAHFISHSQIKMLIEKLNCNNNEGLQFVFPLSVLVADKTFEREVKKEVNAHAYYGNDRRRIIGPYDNFSYEDSSHGYHEPNVLSYVFAAYQGIITKNEMYEYMFREENIGSALENITLIVSGIREQGRKVAKRGGGSYWYSRRRDMLAKPFMEDAKLQAFADNIYEEMIAEVLNVELKRGDSPTIYSNAVKQIKRIYGINNLLAILTAMGEDTLDRTSYFSSNSKRENMSHLLSVCIPGDEENMSMFKETFSKSGIKEKRIIEAALYSPEWINIVGEYLAYEGFVSTCYYFMAHMNERFDDKRKAMIAKFTPLTEEELNDGAFDISWFKDAYNTMGKKHFDTIYDAAKYISDGAKHSRARKYADATLGKMAVSDVEIKISDKRNKDLVMAYSLIPLKNEDDIIRRYLFLQDFLKQSKKFGAQRIASEKKAVEMSMSNLAMNAGYSDVTRLTLRMETKLIADIKELFAEKEIEDVSVSLNVDDFGKPEIVCKKSGKALKSVPAKLKKNEYILKLNENKKRLTDQFKRTKLMFEQAMEEETQFSADELSQLYANPVVSALLRSLIFVCKDKQGFLNASRELIDCNGNVTVLKNDEKLIIAHPLHMYRLGNWAKYQKLLFEKQIVQPFKQVFRELYVKTEEELEMNYSRRYSGNQIQPQKTVACLKGRRWVADVEDGLQKVYYKENIVARIYAIADWFSPSDIEAPTLEWVEFCNRTTNEPIKIKDIPDVIFSEVMRDVDLAVSVAHAGGVDPQTSHSTVEMRAAIIAFTLPLFKINNVELIKNHAIVTGHYGTYDINLGSGVIHKRGGAMINVLPVHSQHRGKIFLPFVDDDPKTAEIITKIIMFAEDKKIKDVNILDQIS